MNNKNILKNLSFNVVLMKNITRLIKDNDKFILTTHTGSDPDGLASEVGMYFLLKKLKKKVIVVNAEKVPDNYSFIVPGDFIKNTETQFEEIDNLNLKGYVLLVLDNSELKRVGKILDICRKNNCKIATIDHHIVKPAKDMFVDASYAATSEIIWELYHYMKISIQKNVAKSLYAGIIADTGNFRFAKTSMRTHIAGGDLVSYGFSPDEVYRLIFESSPPDRLILIKRIIDKAEINPSKSYIVGYVRKSMFRKLKLGDTPTDGIVNQLLAVKGIRISALMTETPDGDLKCSLRSIDDVDVAKLASKFGGGGHKNASGLFIKGPFKKASRKIILEIERTLKH